MAVKRLYEGMFLVDSALAAADWDGTLALIENILKRADAEIVVLRKWDERRLAYDIEHKSRGTYILSYFKVDTQRISGIEKDVQLSEKVMRVLLLTTEDRPSDVVEREIAGLPREPVPVPEPEPVGPSREPVAPGIVEEEGPMREAELPEAPGDDR
jgi:small subunit ribosomal protein S6